MTIDNEFDQVFGGSNDTIKDVQLPAGLAVMMQSMALAGERLITGDEVETHAGQKILVPEGMTFERVMKILQRLKDDSETETTNDRQFLYRPDDGAYATYKVLRKRYGAVLGESKTIESFFGTFSRPAEMRTVKTGFGTSERVPWGLIGIPTLDGVELVLCDRHPHPEYGSVFEIHAKAAKKYMPEIEQIFDEIEEYLRTNSIYRGKAVVGSDDLEFLDLSTFDASKIVFADSVELQFQAGVMTVLEYTQALRDESVPRKQATLMFGPHGTGKTSAMQIIAQKAVENGWTAIFAKAGEDDLNDVLRTARLYMPAVVFVEDIDVEASTGEDNEVRQLLEAFDGVTSKGGELVMVMTTNHIDRIHRGMLRPGRFDFTIEIDKLDSGGVERLIKAVVNPGKLSDQVDYVAVGEAMENFSPAFVRGACDRSVSLAIARLKGSTDYQITTDDLVNAAKSLRPQLELQENASGGEKPTTLESAMRTTLKPVVTDVLAGTVARDNYGDRAFTFVPANGNGNGAHA